MWWSGSTARRTRLVSTDPRRRAYLAEVCVAEAAVELAEVIGAVMAAEEETGQVAAGASRAVRGIDLIYTISEILGHTIRLDEAAEPDLREVSCRRCRAPRHAVVH